MKWLRRLVAWLQEEPEAPRPKKRPSKKVANKPQLSIAVLRTLGKEGGWSKRKSDRGGETIFGISRVKNPDWEGWLLVDAYKDKKKAFKDKKIRALAIKFAEEKYGKYINAHLIPDQDVLNEVFDTVYNMGPIAAKIYQRSLNYVSFTPRGKQLFKNLKVDGDPGTKTTKACKAVIKAGGKDILLKMLDIQQGAGYGKISDRDQSERKKGKRKGKPDQRINMWGWLRHRVGLA